MIRFLLNLLNLNAGEEDKQKTLENVKANISFKGSKLWILACAIIVASVGLNVNSTAVIIGAMLISPLMGPIVGAGFALGIYDFELLKKSLKNLLIATLASIIVATIYFSLSPLKAVQSELLARTAPNIYDVLIAFFGGLVGVIAITRVEKGNPIPGVAIATALMPPLCTVGYGLAIGNWKFFLGAFFLYAINCVFICIATFTIVKYLKYPPIKYLDPKRQKQLRYIITSIVLVMLLPSIFFAFSLFREQQFKETVDHFIEQEFLDDGLTLVYKKITYTSKTKKVELAFLEKQYSLEEVKKLDRKLKKVCSSNPTLIIKKNSSDDLQALRKDILNEVNKDKNNANEKDIRIAELEKKIAENDFNNAQLLAELHTIFPSIYEVAVFKQQLATLNKQNSTIILAYRANPQLNTRKKRKLRNWMLKRFDIEYIKLAAIIN